MTVKRPPPIMVLGCGRSGTSILGELFEHLPDYRYRSEPPFAEVMGADFSSPLAFKVPHESEGFRPDRGLSFPLTVLRERAPEMRFLWIVRHPLDAISSLRIGISQNWTHHPRPPDWQAWLDRPLIERCAHHWAFINALGFSQVEPFATVLRFEDMIADPRAFAEGLCDKLDLGRDAQALATWAMRVQNTNNANFDEAKTSQPLSRPDHTVRVGRWRENLSDEDLALAVPIVGPTSERFGYDLPTG